MHDDLNLIFLNAFHYNREESQIAKDAKTLKVRSKLLAGTINHDVSNAFGLGREY